MQSKGFIKLVAVLLAIACVYQLSFTFKTRSVEKKAAEYAAAFPAEDEAKAQQHYLDSVQNLQVFNLGFRKFTYKECKEKELNLGLDLRGGMNVTLEVQVEDVIKAIAGKNQNDENLLAALEEANAEMKKHPGTSKDYIDAFVAAYERLTNGGALATLMATNDVSKIDDAQSITAGSTNEQVKDILSKKLSEAMDAAFKVLRNRIDHFGVTQPNIVSLPNHRILVELPGVKEPQRVRDLLKGTAALEFWTTADVQEVYANMIAADQYLREQAAYAKAESAEVEATEVAAEQPAESAEAASLVEEVADAANAEVEADEAAALNREMNPLLALLEPNRFAGGACVGAAYKADMAAVEAYLADENVKAIFGHDVHFAWGVKGESKFDGRYCLYALTGEEPVLDGTVITEAREQYQQRGATAEVTMTMDGTGTREWGRITGENINKCIAIVLDGYVYSAPVVRTKIDRGNSSISGDFTIQEAKDLANVLSSGKFPAPARIAQDTVVGPSLGQASINAGLMSFAIAFILVLLYMGIFYKTAGWMSDIALVTNVFLLMGILVSFGAVLTLPGIAGIVLTMGMAVDANVIIYERIKEELRAGKGLTLAIHDGFSKAYSAIIDGNLTTIITGIVLFLFGSGPVQGFATTLVIGIVTSFFSAVFITRLLIEWVVGKWGKISFSRSWSEGFLNNTKVDFLSKRKMSYLITGVVLLVSVLSLAFHGLNLGAEFTGGRAFVIRFDQPVSDEDARARLEETFKNAGADPAAISLEAKRYGSDNKLRVLTQYLFDDSSDEATEQVEMLIYEAVSPLFAQELTSDAFRSTQISEFGIESADKIGPSIASEMTWNAIYSVLFSLIAIGLYIAFRFSRWQWAVGATAALAVNAFFVIGLFSICYSFMPFNMEINQAFIAAILTIIGYAINDTVVVFDRIREFLGLYPKRELYSNVNNAINTTLSRTINTSGTTLVTLLAIFFFGGETIRGFIFALIIGVVVGTAATIFIATPVAYDLMQVADKKKLKK